MDLRQRYAVRGLLISPTNELLLIETRTQHGTMWLTPGGGIEANEDPHQALKRELYEELGYTLEPRLIVEVWRRQFTFTSASSGYPTRQNERYFLIHTPSFTPTFEHVPESSERAAMLQTRWWSYEALKSASDLRFAPRNLAEAFGELLQHVPEIPLLLQDPTSAVSSS